jgi:hypothetical protein
MLTPATTPEEAIEDLTIAKIVEARSENDDSEDLEDVIREFGYDPEDF